MDGTQQFRSGDWADVPPQQQIIEPANTKLSVVLPFIESEIPNVQELLNRSIELSGQIPRVLFLVPFKGVNYVEVKKLAEKAFSQVGVIEDSEGVTSDWQGRQQMRNAAGPNSLFRQAAWFYYLHKQYGSWLWLEPDCWPITARWLYDLEREHFEVGRPFSGTAMAIGDQKRYMNGVAIYPWNAIQYAPLLVQSTMWKQHPEYEVGFDVAGGDDVLRHAHMTKLIQLTNHLAKGNIEVRPETVLCHGRIDLSGSVDSGDTSELREGSHATDLPQPETLVASQGERSVTAQIYSEGGDPVIERCNALRGIVEDMRDETELPQESTSQDLSEYDSKYGWVTQEIRQNVSELVKLWNDQPHRKVLIVKELRRAKLVPKHFR